MKTYKLRGLAEGLVGKSSIKSKNIDELFKQYPTLKKSKKKLSIKKNCIAGFSACDG